MIEPRRGRGGLNCRLVVQLQPVCLLLPYLLYIHLEIQQNHWHKGYFLLLCSFIYSIHFKVSGYSADQDDVILLLVFQEHDDMKTILSPGGIVSFISIQELSCVRYFAHSHSHQLA